MLICTLVAVTCLLLLFDELGLLPYLSCSPGHGACSWVRFAPFPLMIWSHGTENSTLCNSSPHTLLSTWALWILMLLTFIYSFCFYELLSTQGSVYHDVFLALAFCLQLHYSDTCVTVWSQYDDKDRWLYLIHLFQFLVVSIFWSWTLWFLNYIYSSGKWGRKKKRIGQCSLFPS